MWSVAGYLSMVVEGVFGVQDDGRVQPKLPAALVPELFGKQRRISLEADGKRYVLERPKQVGDGLLVAGTVKTRTTTTVQLVAALSRRCPPAPPMPMRARRRPRPYRVRRSGKGWSVPVAEGQVLWRDGRAVTAVTQGVARIVDDGLQHCLSLTMRDGALESLHSPMRCVGPQQLLKGATRWQFTPAKAGRYACACSTAIPAGRSTPG